MTPPVRSPAVRSPGFSQPPAVRSPGFSQSPAVRSTDFSQSPLLRKPSQPSTARRPTTSRTRLLDRRRFLGEAGTGLFGIALAHLLSSQGRLAAVSPSIRKDLPLAPRAPHFAARARRVLVIFCSGAVSHLDSWDYKPALVKADGQAMPGQKEDFLTFQGENGNLAAPLYPFRPRGQSGKMASDLFPHLAELVDEMCFIHSLTAKSNTHGPAENQMSTGFVLDGFPSMGSWCTYALGSEAEDLPAFVAIPDPRGVPQAGINNWNSAFLPAVFQGTAFNARKSIFNLAPPGDISSATDLASREALRRLNEHHMEQFPGDFELSARIASYELAARMQLSVPEVSDLSKESTATLRDYGADDPDPIRSGFAKNCILARRLLERDVRFVQLFNGAYAMGEGVGNWDGHRKLKEQYDIHGPILDKPAAALLRDLRQRGMLDDTLVLWTTEFGRMPTFQKGAQGRDHNPHGFTVWLTGAGVKRGFSFGATDELGFRAVDKVSTIYDLHATLLHLLGLDHERLTFYHNGIERRLTDVHGHVLRDLLA